MSSQFPDGEVLPRVPRRVGIRRSPPGVVRAVGTKRPRLSKSRTSTHGAAGPRASQDNEVAVDVSEGLGRPARLELQPGIPEPENLSRMTDAEFLRWRENDVGVRQKITSNFSAFCRACYAHRGRYRRLDEGTNVYDHMSSARHLACIARTRQDATEERTSRPIREGEGLSLWNVAIATPSADTTTEDGRHPSEKQYLEDILSRMMKSEGAKRWAISSLNASHASSAQDREAVARELAFEVVRRWEWKEGLEGLGDEDVRAATGKEFRANSVLGINFGKFEELL